MGLAEGHVFRLLYDVSVNDKHVGKLCSKTQLDLGAAVEAETHTFRKFWKNTQKQALTNVVYFKSFKFIHFLLHSQILMFHHFHSYLLFIKFKEISSLIFCCIIVKRTEDGLKNEKKMHVLKYYYIYCTCDTGFFNG